ncbi:Vacuolar protein sorting-associated protein 9A [Heracleum sosnowskyi]|uniref:Vacuolar protein sorting-associated protein 9A n=1 Tax=Heracleum sosnowskyi TaxID=360622 RepID=A0AAD8HKS3_9APIA|nr:Vacuolar protein sorting-associated protein 9A [Heracleum sosnowskyi]
MDNGDVFRSPLARHDFLERMRHPSASDFVKSIKTFIVSFLNNAPDPERDSAAVQDFQSNMEAAFRAHSLWAGCSEEELESAGEGLEKYVMTKLFTRVYASVPEEVNEDNQLHQKVSLIQQFIRPQNLDIQPIYQNETSWLLAQKELQKINMYKAPRDKLVCILNCCKVINNLLLNASIASNENPPGADEFLPVLIYVTIKANPPQLHSNLLYIQRYRSQSRLVSEAAYFFTNMLSAESFIMNIDAKSLSMEDTEFEKNMEFAQALLFGPSGSDNMPSQSDQSVGRHQETKHLGTTTQTQVPPQTLGSKSRNGRSHSKDPYALDKVPSISDLENHGANMLMKDENAKQVFMDFPYLYAKSGDLTIGDVEGLLNNYKQLVFKYVCLSKGMGVSVTPPSSALQIPSEDHTKTTKEPEDSRTVEPNDGENENIATGVEVSEVVPKLGEEKSGSKSSEDEAVASQDMIGTENS